MSPYAALMLFKNNLKKRSSESTTTSLLLCVGRRLVSKGGKSAALPLKTPSFPVGIVPAIWRESGKG